MVPGYPIFRKILPRISQKKGLFGKIKYFTKKIVVSLIFLICTTKYNCIICIVHTKKKPSCYRQSSEKISISVPVNSRIRNKHYPGTETKKIEWIVNLSQIPYIHWYYDATIVHKDILPTWWRPQGAWIISHNFSKKFWNSFLSII